MRDFFEDGFRPQARDEPEAVFTLREKALEDALQQVEEGKLDRTYAHKHDQSKVLLKLRKETLGDIVSFLFYYVETVF